MSMTQKDFVAIAAIIRNELDHQHAANTSAAAESSIIEIARNFASHAITENPRFDRARFLKACGVSA